MANRLDDPVEIQSHGCFDQDSVQQWEDGEVLGETMRQLCVTRIQCEGYLLADGFGFLQSEDLGLGETYSELLLDTLSRFERPNQAKMTIDMDGQAELLPSIYWMTHDLLTPKTDKAQKAKTRPHVPVRWTYPSSRTELIPFQPDSDTKHGAELLEGVKRWFGDWDLVHLNFSRIVTSDVTEMPG